jgi:spermidine/putrescine-binding protein
MSRYRFLTLRVALLCALTLTIAACGGGADAETTTTGNPGSESTTTSGSSGTTQAPSTSEISPALMEVIESAGQESGTVNARIVAGLTDEALNQLEDDIEAWSGVRLNVINVDIQEPLAIATSEVQAGVTPSFDLAVETDQAVLEGIRTEVFEKVDWKSILKDDTPEEVVFENEEDGQVGLAASTQIVFWVYNADEIDGSTLNSWADLSNPELRGRVGGPPHASGYARGAFYLGDDVFFEDLRALVANEYVVAAPSDALAERMQIGELLIARVAQQQYATLLDRGLNVEYTDLGYIDHLLRVYLMPKGAANSNSAKLLAVYLASQEGAQWLYENSGQDNGFYEGGLEHGIIAEFEAEGVPVIDTWQDEELLAFIDTPEWDEYLDEVNEIMAGVLPEDDD